jgi:chemotaxis protein MotB
MIVHRSGRGDACARGHGPLAFRSDALPSEVGDDEEEHDMVRGRSWWLSGVALVAIVGASGCAHSEEEWQAKVHEIDELKVKLDAEQARANKARSDLDDSTTKNEQLKQQLKAAGVDISNLNANQETQARAIDEYRRRSELFDAYKRRIELLRSKLVALVQQGVTVTVRNNRLVVQLPGDALFEAGREGLRREGREMLIKLAEVIRSEPSLLTRSFQVVGHVEQTAAGGRFKDGFGLSVMRAREVQALLVQPADKGGGGLNVSRWSVAGYGDADPLKSNDTPEGKQANRRCEIVVQPSSEDVLDLKALAP